MAQFAQGFGFDLADTFAGYVKLFADFFERVVGIHVDTEAHTQDFGFARGLARYAPEITRHNAFALCFELEENNFYPQSFLQLRVKDLCLESELSERLTDR